MKPRGVAVLGATGSIGISALRVLSRHAARFRVAALTGGSRVEELARVVAQTRPSYVGIVQPNGEASRLWHSGEQVLVEAATHPDVDIVINAVVGAAGLDATLAALRLGRRVALANKESLVMAGALVMNAARDGGGEVVPVDSEHSAILQALGGRPTSEIRRLIITASGGPFRDWDPERLREASIADALQHPTWRMGRKISVDSATLANKALEVLEAHVLFGVPLDAIDVVVHPQSIVHSMIEFVDGSVVAQLGVPSMELPILYALTHPDRLVDEAMPRFDPIASSPLTFEAVRHASFPALELGIGAGRTGGAAPAVFNAANEAAVAQFLQGACGFADIPKAIESALDRLQDLPGTTCEELVAADKAARNHVSALVEC